MNAAKKRITPIHIYRDGDIKHMVSIKSVAKAFIFIISGIAIVVVGGFMMGAVARLWMPKDDKKPGVDKDGVEKTG